MNRLDKFISRPYICLITPGNSHHSNFESQKESIVRTVRDAVRDGVNVIQIREKSLPARSLYELAGDVAGEVRKTRAIVLVNDRPDIARAAGAHGVHLPEASLPPSVVRRIFGDEFIVGVSTHTLEAAIAASQSGADYLFYGPVFETPGKGAPVGPDDLHTACTRVGQFPVIALGGIDGSNARQVLDAGASGLAAIRALNEAASRRSICRIAEDFKASLG